MGIKQKAIYWNGLV